MADITQPRILNMGPVSISRAQDYRLFAYALLIAIGVGIGLYWSYLEGVLTTQVYLKLGPYISFGFAGLLLAGLFAGLTEAFGISRSLNALKRERLGSEELKLYFGVDNFGTIQHALLKTIIQNRIFRARERVKNYANLSAYLGLLGTALGLAGSLGVLGGVANAQDVLAELPKMSGHLSMAFIATVVGIIITVIINQVYRLVQFGGMDLQTRILRSLEGGSSQAGGEG